MKDPQLFKYLNFPHTYIYRLDSNHIPLKFYEDTFPIAKTIYLLLGYFSSNAIKFLSKSFASFIYNGCKTRFIINHFFPDNLIDNTKGNNEDLIIDFFKNHKDLVKNLSKEAQYFFDWLKFLLKNKKLELIPVKFNGFDLANYKKNNLF
jgi:hypothetical protein